MSDAITGRVLGGRYQITGHVRATRMGGLYVGRRADDDERVLVKVLDPDLFAEAEAIARFERESEVVRRIAHPCSLRELDHGRTDGLPWLVLEYLDAEPLSEILEEHGALPPERAARVAGQVALGLGAAHALGVIHRDLQPAHVLVARGAPSSPSGPGFDVVKVTEFGLARLSSGGGSGSDLTAVGVRIGTPQYMAPEYIEDYELDHRADLYALGVVLYEMLVGKPLFEGRPYKVLDQHLTAPAPRPSARAPGVPPWLDALVLQLLAKKPADRIQTAAELAARIEEGLGAPLLPRPAAQPAPTKGPTPVPVQRAAAPRPAAPATPAAKPAATPSPVKRVVGPATPHKDPIFEGLIRDNTLSVQRSRGPALDRRDALVVDRVARASIAGALGIREGWLAHFPDEPASGLRDTAVHAPTVQKRRYRFSGPDGERLDLLATGMPVGVDLIRTVEHVRAHGDAGVPADALVDLWKQKDWENLERLAMVHLAGTKSGSGGLFSKLLGGPSAPTIKHRDHPALVLYAAARIEQHKPGGRELVQEYRSRYASHWPNVYDAIAHYYLAQESAQQRADQAAVDLLWQSLQIHPLEPAQILLEGIIHKRIDHRAWVGRLFPLYELDRVDGLGRDGLAPAHSEMDDAQLIVICMLGGHRRTVDYDAFLRRYLTFAGWFSSVLFAVHVLTSETVHATGDHGGDSPEDLVIRAGVRLRVLHDDQAFVQRQIKPPSVPTVYAVDRTGVVVHEGSLRESDLWDALALASGRRMERLHGG